MTKLKLTGNGRAENVATMVRAYLLNSVPGCRLVDETSDIVNGSELYIKTFEQDLRRLGVTVNATVIILGGAKAVTVYVQGCYFSNTLLKRPVDASKELVDAVKHCLLELNFTVR
jgi:hypothetical protein